MEMQEKQKEQEQIVDSSGNWNLFTAILTAGIVLAVGAIWWREAGAALF